MTSYKNIKAVIWDWNGTLLDDVAPCVSSMNTMLANRQYAQLSTSRYKDIFTFPVKDYYINAGIDLSKHDWDTIAHEFIDLYRERVIFSGLHPEADPVLKSLQRNGCRQFVLSAMQQEFLMATISERISPDLFEKIAGLDNHYAHSKADTGLKLLNEIGLPKEQLLMIGDTLHDFEVAQVLGIDCVLFSGGHQSRNRLEKSGALVIDDLMEVATLIGCQ
jgi:phosphoglycolate phosphatase